MRYDEYVEYNNRYASRGGSRRDPSYGRGGDYDRGRRDYDRGRSRDYDRGRREYDRGRDYGRGYDRGYDDYDGYDRYGSRDRVPGPDLEDWESTAPNWDDHGNSRGRSGGRPSGSGRGSGGGRPPQRRGESSRGGSGAGGASRRSSRSGQSGGQSRSSGSASSRRKESGSSRGSGRSSKPPKPRKAFSPVPIVVGVAVIIMALLVINSITGGKEDCVIEFSAEEIVVGETATATVINLPEGADESTIHWTSNDNNIVTVTGEGAKATLLAKREGKATIGAQLGDDEAISGTVNVVRTATGVLGITVGQEEMTIPRTALSPRYRRMAWSRPGT